jgi:hypothetical protein
VERSQNAVVRGPLPTRHLTDCTGMRFSASKDLPDSSIV